MTQSQSAHTAAPEWTPEGRAAHQEITVESFVDEDETWDHQCAYFYDPTLDDEDAAEQWLQIHVDDLLELGAMR